MKEWKRALFLPFSRISGSVGHFPSTVLLEQRSGVGTVSNAECSVGLEFWGQKRIQWSSVIRSLAHTHPSWAHKRGAKREPAGA